MPQQTQGGCFLAGPEFCAASSECKYQRFGLMQAVQKRLHYNPFFSLCCGGEQSNRLTLFYAGRDCIHVSVGTGKEGVGGGGGGGWVKELSGKSG